MAGVRDRLAVSGFSNYGWHGGVQPTLMPPLWAAPDLINVTHSGVFR